MIRLDGIDVSHHNDNAAPIDWDTVRKIPTDFAATKATEGTGFVDPTFVTHRAEMNRVGFRWRLFYHWLNPQRPWLWGGFARRPEDQAAHYLRTIAGLGPHEGCMLDAEEGGITVADVLTWCETVEAATHRPCSVYTGAYVAGGTIWQSTAVRHSDYGLRPMHLAAYTSEAKAKALPGVKAYPWSAWQWSSNGPVPGVVGRCDMNRIDIPEHYDVAAGVNAEPWPPPHPDPPPPNPPQEDDPMIVSIFELVDSKAAFVADTQQNGLASRVRWSGAGDAKWAARRATILANGGRVLPASIGNLINFALDGPLPTGDPDHDWDGSEFANTAEIQAGSAPAVAVDETARQGVAFLHAENEARAERDDKLRDAQLAAWNG